MSKEKGTKPAQKTGQKVDLAVLEANMNAAWAKYEELWDVYKAASNDETDTAQKEAYKVYKAAKKAFTNAGGVIEETEIPKEHLSLAGEYAVASELCRRGIYAQLTLGTRKKTDILVDSDKAMLRIQVKSKQGNGWPSCRGVFGKNIMLVLVDYEGKTLEQRPDFYVITPTDWDHFVHSGWIAADAKSGRLRLDAENCPIWDKTGRGTYKGVRLTSDEVEDYKECWDKIETFLK